MVAITVAVHSIALHFTGIAMVACGRNRTGRKGKSAAFGGDSVYRSGAPRSMKMGNIASPWRYELHDWVTGSGEPEKGNESEAAP
jgi:hypothetical protein